METLEQKDTILRGGQFIVAESSIEQTFIPEEINDDQKMIKSMVEDFVNKEISPNFLKIEKQEGNITSDIMEKMGELGLLGAHMPEEYGGMQLDTNTNTVIADRIGPAKSFSVTFAAHTGIGMLPILYFGNQDQKEKYLPGLISGQLKASYCLTEPGSGSDALAAKTVAMSEDGGESYEITGQKMWITNAGFADVLIVFAQVDGDKFTGFIIDAKANGITLGAEEDKLGIKGSSTRQVFFDKVKVGKDAILGNIGKGHLIAFNALNIGRFKLGALCMGASKKLVDVSIEYATERKQFGKSISEFGAIKHKLAEQVIQVFATESAQYRVSNMIQEKIKSLTADGIDYGRAKLKAAEEYAIECAILKVSGSECLDFVVDEAVQIYGGMGFSEESMVAGAYRDARINRIFEGTNEINRLLIIDMLFRRGLKGAFDLVGPAWAVQKELSSMPKIESLSGYLSQEKKSLLNLKKMALMTIGGAAKKQVDGELNLKNEQEIVMNSADILIDIFLAESMILRVEKLNTLSDKPADQSIYEDILKTFLYDCIDRVSKNSKDAVASYAGGDIARIFNMGIQRYGQNPMINIKESRRRIADFVISKNKNTLA